MGDAELSTTLPAFSPPYVLGGRLAVVAGWARHEGIAVPALPVGFAPIEVAGRALVVVVLTRYDEVPKELPIRYSEAVLSIVARRGLEIVSVPFDMVLDAREPTELGILHYGLPKRFVPEFSLNIAPSLVEAEAPTLQLRARVVGPVASSLALPLRASVTLGMRLFTSRVRVLGASHPPLRVARIALDPEGWGHALTVREASFGTTSLCAMWGQSWRWTTTHLGAPASWDAERT